MAPKLDQGVIAGPEAALGGQRWPLSGLGEDHSWSPDWARQCPELDREEVMIPKLSHGVEG